MITIKEMKIRCEQCEEEVDHNNPSFPDMCKACVYGIEDETLI